MDGSTHDDIAVRSRSTDVALESEYAETPLVASDDARLCGCVSRMTSDRRKVDDRHR